MLYAKNVRDRFRQCIGSRQACSCDVYTAKMNGNVYELRNEIKK